MLKPSLVIATLAGLGAPASATEITFTLPIKSGPLLGEIATGTVDLEDGVFTGVGSESFFDPDFPQSNVSAGDILSFSFTVLTLTFTDDDRLGSPSDFRVRLQDGVVQQFDYSGALFDPGASLFVTVTKGTSKGDIRTTGGQGEQLQSIGSPFEFTVIP